MRIGSLLTPFIIAASLTACHPMSRPMAKTPKADTKTSKADTPSMPAWDPTKQVHYICTFNSDISVEGILLPAGTRIKTSLSQEQIFGGSARLIPIEQYQMKNSPWKPGKKELSQLTISVENLRLACPAKSWTAFALVGNQPTDNAYFD